MTPKQHYRDSVTNALAGYQLTEGLLKFYAEIYYKAVRFFLGDNLHFDFHRKDVETSPLGRLISGFSKTCNNKRLVADLRDLLGHRDQIAHQALLCLYDDGTPEETFHEMIQENHRIISKLHLLQNDILSEVHLIRKKLELMHRG